MILEIKTTEKDKKEETLETRAEFFAKKTGMDKDELIVAWT